jgi:hypothetical protein
VVSAGEDPDGLCLLAVPRHRAELVAVDADHVGQRVRVTLSLLAPEVP